MCNFPQKNHQPKSKDTRKKNHQKMKKKKFERKREREITFLYVENYVQNEIEN